MQMLLLRIVERLRLRLRLSCLRELAFTEVEVALELGCISFDRLDDLRRHGQPLDSEMLLVVDRRSTSRILQQELGRLFRPFGS